jgi:hypothetical protein
VRLQRVVAVADVGVGQDEDPLGQRDVVLDPDLVGEVEQALVADEAVVTHPQAAEAAAVQVEEPHVVEDRAPPDGGPQQAQPRRAHRRDKSDAIGDHGQGEEAEAQGAPGADLAQRLHGWRAARIARRNATSFPK